MVGDCSARFLALNHGKRVVEADLRTASGRETVRDLARNADVFLHNLAPGKAARMGLDDEDLLKINQGLVYAYASGWGEERGCNPPPGTDFVAQAYSGLAHNVRPAGQRPAGSLMTLLDVLGGLIAAEGIVAALLNRHRTGRGQRISSSLLSAAGVLQAPIAESAAAPQPVWGGWDTPVPTADGHVMVAAGSRAPRSLSPRDLVSQTTAEALATLHSAGLCAVAVCADLAALATDPAVSQFVELDGCALVRPPWRFTP
jgi:crotonobetainyl-CoA:carnitine CoA-transferase CaiB-like acyl-CoA transferase